ncbi:MAG: 4'-phosphopantetheinyl transferase family protein [Nodosilinea sp.]
MDSVQIWEINTATVSQPCSYRLRRCLSLEEQHRLDRFKSLSSQRNFLVGRGCLRHLLSHRLGRSPASLEFTYGPQGKPLLKPQTGVAAPHFNLSHSGDRLLIVISPYPVGIDVEQIRPLANLQGLCQRCLTPREQRTLLSLPQSQANQVFFYFWTGKEAYLKATGQGLTLAMTEVELAPETELGAAYPIPLSVLGDLGRDWLLYQWRLRSDHVAALALQPEIMAMRPELVLRFSPISAVLAMPD